MMPFFVPTRFYWRFGGKQVHLCGSFTRWVETVSMAPVEGQPGVFAVLVHLPPGYHQYKFIVDGEWRHDETQPFMPDPLGNVNNWLYVRQPDASGAVPLGLHLAANQGALAQHLDGTEPSRLLPGNAQPMARIQMAQPASVRPNQQSAHHLAGAGGSGPLRPGPVGPRTPIRGPMQQQMVTGPHLQGSPVTNDVDMQNEGVVAPIAIQEDEPACTRKKVHEFLAAHTAYELIPESGKVVVIDMDFSVRQAFHALHEQSIASAPLWDNQEMTIMGMISASDFIQTLKWLRQTVSTGVNPLSEAEMDTHTIRIMRDEAALEGREPKPLAYVKPTDSFHSVVKTLVENRCSVAPILSCDPVGSEDIPNVLHIATISGVLACLMRHFRASFASLPLLSQPLGSMPIGTWSPDSPIGQQGSQAQGHGTSMKVAPIHTVHPDVPLTTALSMLLEAGISALPVVDASGVLLDIYARGDITLLAKGNAYNRLQWEDVTVGQALMLAGLSQSQANLQAVDPATLHAQGMASEGLQHGAHARASKSTRLFVCTRQDALRLVLERLSMPAVRRVIVVHPETTHVEGIISLSDVARFMFL